MIADGRKVIGSQTAGYWGDIGTPEELEQMQHIVQDAALAV